MSTLSRAAFDILADSRRQLQQVQSEARIARLLQHRQPPVSDHAFIGDGSDDPTWCSCGRSASQHLRH